MTDDDDCKKSCGVWGCMGSRGFRRVEQTVTPPSFFCVGTKEGGGGGKCLCFIMVGESEGDDWGGSCVQGAG